MGKEIGKVIHYYDKANVAVIKLDGGGLKVGDMVTFKKGEEEHAETIESMQVEHKSVDSVKKGEEVAVKVSAPAKEGTKLYTAE